MDVLGTLGTVGAFLAILVVLVLIHEFGHFLAAKAAGITVEEFGVGFPPRVASFTWRGTRYSLNVIPLGGFVKMLGEDGEIQVERLREEGLSEPEIEQAMEGAFNRRPIWVRIGVLLAGVTMNFVFAVAAFSVAASLPQPFNAGPLRVISTQEGSPADGVLLPDDLIIAADGQQFERSSDMTGYISSRAGRQVALSVVRDDQDLSISIVPRRLTEEQVSAGQGAIGFRWTAERTGEDPPLAANPIEAIRSGFTTTTRGMVEIPSGLARTVGGLIGLNPDGASDARGPIGIAQVTGEVLNAGLLATVQFIGILSINLAVLNVLPFPPLDGGRIAVVLVEAVRRRRLPAEREALIYLTGFVVLLALVFLISIQDIQRL